MQPTWIALGYKSTLDQEKGVHVWPHGKRMSYEHSSDISKRCLLYTSYLATTTMHTLHEVMCKSQVPICKLTCLTDSSKHVRTANLNHFQDRTTVTLKLKQHFHICRTPHSHSTVCTTCHQESPIMRVLQTMYWCYSPCNIMTKFVRSFDKVGRDHRWLKCTNFFQPTIGSGCSVPPTWGIACHPDWRTQMNLHTASSIRTCKHHFCNWDATTYYLLVNIVKQAWATYSSFVLF
jgi:hypothetical protein